MTDKSDTRGRLDTAAIRVRTDRASRGFTTDTYRDLREVWAELDGLCDHSDAALSCVRRLLDGLEQACADSFTDPVSAAMSYIEHAGPLSPSEVHIIEMVRGEG